MWKKKLISLITLGNRTCMYTSSSIFVIFILSKIAANENESLYIHFSHTYTYKYDSSTSPCLRYSNNKMCKIWWCCAKKGFIGIKISFSSQFGMFHETYQERSKFEPAHKIMALFVLCKLILQIRMHSHPVGLDVWFLVWPFVYFHSSCLRTAGKSLKHLPFKTV